MNEQTKQPDVPCDSDTHHWPADYADGDTCNCGEWYLLTERGGIRIERAEVAHG